MALSVAALAAVLAAQGCGGPTYQEPQPLPVPRPPAPPEAVLRIPPDFTFRDYTTGKQYFFRRYTATTADGTVRPDRLGRDGDSIATVSAAGGFALEVISVVDAGIREERLATEEERTYALEVLQEDWVKRGRDDLLTFHRDAVERERRMRDDLLDERIYYTMRVVNDLKEERFRLDCDLISSMETEGYKAKEGHLEWIEKEIAKRDGEIITKSAELEMLKYQKQLRDSQLKRSSARTHVRDWLPVKDLVDAGMGSDRLVEEIRSSVKSDSWKDPAAVIRFSSGYLEIANSRAVVEMVREYLESVRARQQH